MQEKIQRETNAKSFEEERIANRKVEAATRLNQSICSSLWLTCMRKQPESELTVTPVRHFSQTKKNLNAIDARRINDIEIDLHNEN
jgi:hypothetical protein